MDAQKRHKLEAAGWRVASTADFLDLTPDESAYIELKLALSKHLKQIRTQKELTQEAVAERIKSSQSRVAKMEAGDPSVSIDLLVKTLLSIGATRSDLAEVIATAK